MNILSEERAVAKSGDLYSVIARHRLVILLSILVGAAAAVSVQFALPRSYLSRADAVILTPQTGNVQDAVAANTLAVTGAANVKTLGQSQLVAQTVATQLRDGRSATELLRGVTVDVDTGSRFVRVEAQGSTPESAQSLAREWVAALQKALAATGDATNVRVEPLGEAELPRQSSGLPLSVGLAGGLAAGLILGLGLAFARDAQLRRRRTARQGQTRANNDDA